MVYLTVYKNKSKELSHYLTFSDIFLARSFLLYFDFEMIQEHLGLNEPTNSFWVHYDSKLTALIWYTKPKTLNSNYV